MDIVLKIIWYRLGEVAGNMADGVNSFYDWYQTTRITDLDPVNVLFVFWWMFTLGIVVLVNLYFKHFGPRRITEEDVGPARPVHGPSQQADWSWVNNTLRWLYMNYPYTQDFMDAWLIALNERCQKQQTEVPMQVLFTGLDKGTFLPRVANIHTEPGEDNLVILCSVTLHEVGMTVTASADAIKATKCKILVNKLRGELKLTICTTPTRDLNVTATFSKTPDIKMKITPQIEPKEETEEGIEETKSLNSQGEPKTEESTNNVIDIKVLESIIHNTISNTQLAVTLSPNPRHVPLKAVPRSPGVVENIKKERRPELFLTPNGAPPKPPRVVDRRLLVKIIKANGLGGSDPYTVVEMDYPSQKHITSVVKNTANPFWDEHFLFDLADETEQVKFELYDRSKMQGEDFLGRAVSRLEDLREHPSSRQIIPLVGRPGLNETVKGSVTVEYLFMEPAEAKQYEEDTAPQQVSPRRRIDTSRTVTPGGTLITTTTTTTAKLKDQKLDAALHESPNKIEKLESDRHIVNGEGQEIVYVNGTDNVATAALQSLQERKRRARTPTKTSTLIITSVHRTDGSPVGDHAGDSSEPPPTPRSAKRQSLGKRFMNRLRKPRSHSVERSSGIKEENLLRPPDQRGIKTTGKS